MLIFDLKHIGNNLYEIRTKKLLSRLDVAEKADLSDRTYADIERGNVNMRIETFLKICNALNITPNDILTIEQEVDCSAEHISTSIKNCSEKEKQTALGLLNLYINSLNK